jgi:hypothetical protein
MNTNHKDGTDERTFLHDLATPLGTAMLLADSILEDVRTRPSVDPDDLMRLENIFQSLEKLDCLIRDRRQDLISRGVPSARP